MEASKSINNCSSWTRYELTTTTGFAYTIEINPDNSDIVYIGGNGGLYKTTNAGTSWSSASSGISGYVYDITINHNNTNVLYAATGNGVYKTTNQGTSWSYTGCSSVNDLAIDPTDSSIIYAGTNTGVYKTTSSGSSWTIMNSGLEDTYITSLGINPNTYLFAGTETAGMFRWDLNIGVDEHETGLSSCRINIYPNPSKARTTLSYQLSTTTLVKLCIYDVQGRLIKDLINGTQNPGIHSISWNGLDNTGNRVSAGIYFSELKIDNDKHIEKVIILH